MGYNYSKFITGFSTYNNILKRRIVTSGFFSRIFLLLQLVVFKSFFVLVSLPYFLLVQTPAPDEKDLESVTASPQRFQQVLVLSFVSIAAVAVFVQTLSSSVFHQFQPFSSTHGAVDQHLQFIGTRSFDEKAVPAIETITASGLEHTVTFEGTGPSYANVAVFVDEGEALVGTVTVNANGRWKFVKTKEMGVFEKMPHSAFALFYGDDNMVLGKPTASKSFDFSDLDYQLFILGYLGTGAIFFAIIVLGVLVFSVVKLRRAAAT